MRFLPLILLALLAIGCTQVECNENQDCTACENNHKARALCINGSCGEPWVYECSEECGAECIRDIDCGDGRYCDAETCSCKDYEQCSLDDDCEEGYYCSQGLCLENTYNEYIACAEASDCVSTRAKSCCASNQVCINKGKIDEYNSQVLDCEGILCPAQGAITSNEIDCTCKENKCIEKTGCERDSDCPNGLEQPACIGDWSCQEGKCVYECREIEPNETGFTFSVGPCDEINAYVTETGINKTEWYNGSLRVTVHALLTCGETPENGDYSIDGERITLKFEYMPCHTEGPCADCMCAHELTYEFIGLEEKEYEFELELIDKSKKCENDEDCASIPVACCDCMNGGQEMCVNKETKKGITREWCESQACPTVVNLDGCVNCSCIEGVCEST